MHSWDSFDFPLRGLPNRGYANVLRFGSVLAQGCVIPTRVLIAKKSTVSRHENEKTQIAGMLVLHDNHQVTHCRQTWLPVKE